jgi:hypothetical protein
MAIDSKFFFLEKAFSIFFLMGCWGGVFRGLREFGGLVVDYR